MPFLHRIAALRRALGSLLVALLLFAPGAAAVSAIAEPGTCAMACSRKGGQCCRRSKQPATPALSARLCPPECGQSTLPSSPTPVLPQAASATATPSTPLHSARPQPAHANPLPFRLHQRPPPTLL